MVINEPNEEPTFDWMQPIRMFLENHSPPDANAEVERIACKSKQYHPIDGVLFRRGTKCMVMKCISRAEDIQLLWDIHSGICRSHSSWHSMTGKAFKNGFYLTTTHDGAMEIITKYRDCQFFQKKTMKYVNPLQPIDISWPFTIRRINIVGVLPRAPGGFRFLFVAIDTFTKWMEVMPVVNITQDAVVKFLHSLIYRFGVPRWVLTDNGTQFKGAEFARCCTNFGIHHQASSTAHPQTNEQVERANRHILQGMKAMMFHNLEAKVRNWHKKLSSILWALRTNINKATETPCFIWFMGQMLYCCPKSILNQLGWHSSMKQIRLKQGSSTPIF
jgi:hypothetical protein